MSKERKRRVDPSYGELSAEDGGPTDISAAQRCVDDAWLENAHSRQGLLLDECIVVTGDAKAPFKGIVISHGDLVCMQPRLIPDVETLLRLQNLCERQRGEISLKTVRDQLKTEINAVLRYWIDALGYRVSLGRPRASEGDIAIRRTRLVGEAITTSRHLVRFELLNPDPPSWKSMAPSDKRKRRCERLRKAGFRAEQIQAYIQLGGTRPVKNMKAKRLEKLALALAAQVVANREGLEESGPVLRSIRQPAYPRVKPHNVDSEEAVIPKLADWLEAHRRQHPETT